MFFQELKVLHEVAYREIGWIALAVVSEFLARLKTGDIRHRQLLAAVTASLKHSADQILMLPGKAAEQNRDPVALLGSESAFYGAMEMSGLIESGNLAQAHALGFQPALDFRIVFNLDEIRRHEFLRRLVRSDEGPRTESESGR